MRKFLKILGIVIGALVILAVIAAITVSFVINPNDYKPLLSKKIQEYTGKTAHFEGHIGLSLFPHIGVTLNDIEIMNPKGFGDQKTFLSLQKAQVYAKIIPLFYQKVETKDIVLKGLTLNLVTNKQGKNNWDNTPAQPQTSNEQAEKKSTKNTKETESKTNTKDKKELKTTNQAKAETTQETSKDSTKIELSIPGFDITNTAISWVNFKTNQSLKISNLNLSAHNIEPDHPIKVKTSFNFQSKKPNLKGSASITATVIYSEKTQKIHIKKLNAVINIAGDKVPNKNLKITLQGDYLISPTLIQLKNLLLKANQSTLTGNLKITSSTPLNEIKQKKLASFLRPLTVEGQLLINNLSVINLKQIQQIKIAPTGRNGIITLPTTAKMYQGTLNGKAQINAQKSPVSLSLIAALSNVQLKGLVPGDFLSGNTNAQFNLIMRTLDSATMIRTLNGHAKFKITNGNISIDFVKFMKLAQGLSNPLNIVIDTSSKGSTVFSSLTGTATLNNGVLTNNDLYIASKITDVKGQGTVNFVTQNFKYNFEANQNTKNLIGGVPLEISGTFQKYHVLINPLKLLQNTIEKNSKAIINQTFGRIKGLLD